MSGLRSRADSVFFCMRLNCDLGEGLDNDAAIMPYLDQANIACGAHAGDAERMQITLALALEHRVQIGAHVGYDDPEHFGRRRLDLSRTEIRDLACWQIDSMLHHCSALNAELCYVKPHGALYNQMMESQDILSGLFDAVALYDDLAFMLMAVADRHKYVQAADHYDIPLIFEAFIDRAYEKNGTLRSRDQAGSTLQSVEQIEQQCRDLVQHKRVALADGDFLSLEADTLCVHGDHPLAEQIASLAREILTHAH